MLRVPTAVKIANIRTLRSLAAGMAGACALGVGEAPALGAELNVIVPQPVATFDLPSEDSEALRWFSNWLLRPDGSFGYFTERYRVPIDGPTELVSAGGPVAPGQLRRQPLEGVLGGLTPSREMAVTGSGGYDWVVHETESGPALLAIDDRGHVATQASLGVRGGTHALALVPTGAGLRILLREATSDGPVVRRANGTAVAHVDQLDSLRSAVGRADGSILLSGFGQLGAPKAAKAWSESVVRVTARGRVSLARDRRGRLVSGDPLAAVRGGVLISKAGEDLPFRHQQISLLTDDARVVHRTDLADLDLPWSNACLASRVGVKLTWAASDASGLPILGVDCFRRGDSDDVSLESFTVGLDREFRARWAVAGNEQPNLGADARLYSVIGLSRLVAWRVPGDNGPRRGRVVSVRRVGTGAAVTIRCRANHGTVCAGTVRLTRGSSKAATTLPYALYGRPGKSAAAIRRHFDALPAGSGPLRATVTE